MNCNKILIIGKIPPPIGGVTIHVNRLIEHFEIYDNNKIQFVDLDKVKILTLINFILKYRIIHLHTSHVYFRFFVSLFCFLFFKKLIITIHGELGRYNLKKNIFDYFSVAICYIPIVINKRSYALSKRLNKNTILLTAFLPPLNYKLLPADIIKKIESIRNKYSYIFCTNAFNVSWDKNGEEIYGIIQLITIFSELKKQVLIFSDPSSAYKNYLDKNKIEIPENVILISFNHDFFEVLKVSDVFIRNTTTDGDSLSIKEALYLRKTVFATNIVDRPLGCILYSKQDSLNLKNIIENYTPIINYKNSVDSCYTQLSDLYSKLLE